MNIYSNLNKSLCELFDVEYNPNEVYGEPNIEPHNSPGCWTKGLKLTVEHKQAIRESLLGNKHSKKTNLKKSVALKGKPLSEETKKKMSIVSKGKPKSNEHRSKIILNLRVDKTCPNCGTIMDAGNYAKFHGDKCKSVVSIQQ